MLDLPWSTEIMDSIDIEGSRDVEATLRGLIKPAVADAEEGDAAEVEPVVADVEEGDAAEVERAVADLEEGDTAKIDPAEVDVQKIDQEKELAGNETDGSQDFDTRVEEAQLPDDVSEVALGEVGMLDPWSTEMDSIDIEESRDLEATLRGLIKPAVADVEEDDPAEVEPLVADLDERADGAPAGPHDDDTVQMPAVLAGLNGGGQPPLQLPEQQVVEPALVEAPPKEKRRFRSLALAATALAVLLCRRLVVCRR
jgi:hypothetical protein